MSAASNKGNSQSKRLTICSVGDLMPCDSPLYVSMGVGSRYSDIEKGLFDECCHHLTSADIAIGNFEAVVHQPRNSSLRERQMSCPQTAVRDLRDAGFSILNIANNHTLQHGVGSFEDTVNACEHAGIQVIGLKDEPPLIVEVNSIRIAFLALCIHIEWYEPNDVRYEDRIEFILERVKQLRTHDSRMVIVVSVHWGDEFAMYPSNAQVALAHTLIDSGADVIFGHHSHVYQGIEQYKNGVIAYSQGNFVSDMTPDICRETGLLYVMVTVGNDERLAEYHIEHYRIGSDLIPHKEEGDWLDSRQENLEKVLCGEVSDDAYWEMVGRNHGVAHAAFRSFFAANALRYDLCIAVRMMIEFASRKVKRLQGRSTDGRVSSMDSEIRDAIARFTENQNEGTPE